MASPRQARVKTSGGRCFPRLIAKATAVCTRSRSDSGTYIDGYIVSCVSMRSEALCVLRFARRYAADQDRRFSTGRIAYATKTFRRTAGVGSRAKMRHSCFAHPAEGPDEDYAWQTEGSESGIGRARRDRRGGDGPARLAEERDCERQ